MDTFTFFQVCIEIILMCLFGVKFSWCYDFSNAGENKENYMEQKEHVEIIGPTSQEDTEPAVPEVTGILEGNIVPFLLCFILFCMFLVLLGLQAKTNNKIFKSQERPYCPSDNFVN